MTVMALSASCKKQEKEEKKRHIHTHLPTAVNIFGLATAVVDNNTFKKILYSSIWNLLALLVYGVLTDTLSRVSTAVLSSTSVSKHNITSCLGSLFLYYSGLLARLILRLCCLTSSTVINQSLSLIHSLHFLMLVLF